MAGLVTGLLNYNATLPGTITAGGAISGASLNITSLLAITSDGTKTTFLPATGDYTRFGDATTTSHTLNTNDDVEVTGRLEVDGILYIDDTTTNGGAVWTSGSATGSIYHNGSALTVATSAHNIVFSPGSGQVVMPSDYNLVFGSSAEYGIKYETAGSENALKIGVGTSTRTVAMFDKADLGTDYAIAAATHPTIKVYSATAAATSTAQWGSIYHNTTDFCLAAGTGIYDFVNAAYTAGAVTDTGYVTLKVAGTSYQFLVKLP